MSKHIRIDDQFYDRLQSLAIQNKRSIGAQLEYMIDRSGHLFETQTIPPVKMAEPKKDYGSLLKHKK